MKDNSVTAGELIGERYRVVRELGRGGMGVVYEAVQEPLGRRVALKLLRPELAEDVSFAARFRREAELAASLGHPNIAQVTDFGVDQGRPFLVMDLLQGESLAELLAREGQLSESRAAFIASQMLDALCAAHARGVVHRDLKPDNVFLSRISGVADVVRLLDFGIAHSSEDETTRMTRTGQVLGTPAYMSPEQARGRAVDEASDLYAVGVCLYETTSGRLPFDTSNYHELLFSIVGEEPTPLATLRPDLSPEFCAVVTCAMAKDKSERFADATSMREALLPLAQAESVVRATPGASSATPPRTPSSADLALAPTVTPTTGPPKQSTPAAFASTMTPATEPPPPAELPALASTHGRRPRRWIWLLPGFAIAALALTVGRVTNTPAPVSAPVTEGLSAGVEASGASAPPAAMAGAVAIPQDAGSALAATSDAGSMAGAVEDVAAPVALPTMEPRASRVARRVSARRRTRRVDCDGTPRELPIVQRGEVVRATSFMGNHVVGLPDLHRQVGARLPELSVCLRGHPMVRGRWWHLTLDAAGVVQGVEPNRYCPLDSRVLACVRTLWMGYRFEGFNGHEGRVSFGLSLPAR